MGGNGGYGCALDQSAERGWEGVSSEWQGNLAWVKMGNRKNVKQATEKKKMYNKNKIERKKLTETGNFF